MKIATAHTRLSDASQAAHALARSLKARLTTPQLLMVYFTEQYDADQLRETLSELFPEAQMVGCSTCCGVMTQSGYIEGPSIAVWACNDEKGCYGSALVPHEPHRQVADSARIALNQAIENSGRCGELPKLIALHSTPGEEEHTLAAIREELGVAVPVIGGSAAADSVQGQWRVFDSQRTANTGVAISVFYPSARVSYSFHSGYAATQRSATVTDVRGRQLVSLDHQPAAEVYKAWYEAETGIAFDTQQPVFTQSTLYPLGTQTGTIHGLPYYTLAHPMAFNEQGHLELFSQLEVGQSVYLMSGTSEGLVARASRVVESANDHALRQPEPLGGLAIYCAGCMLHVKDKLEQVAHNINIALYDAPFVCPFTFGEQGLFKGGELSHGNLMISAVLFHKD
ncbi:FIST signal transduction protein [Salinivibrio proteolyticus]|uniref:FIST C-terminal domain-containing protein n=1 Tax=Salinivibrio proteolyticus TaxID=334715 RepID=A0ABY7LIJ4_9GAMM|nr:FIST N-terminal domain-containing protein [Salinivibrio proteolyticus]WBA16021.1 FIST C-terminal domain-containing protein [Salinivibrio proteolyticus]